MIGTEQSLPGRENLPDQRDRVGGPARRVVRGSEVFRFLEQNRAAVQAMEASKDRFARFRGRLDTLVDLLAGPDAPLRDRVRASAAMLSVGATCHVYLQQVDDPDKLRAIVLEMATDLIH